MRSEEEVQEMADKASDATSRGTKYPGMTYEEGIRAALEWVLDDNDDNLEGDLL